MRLPDLDRLLRLRLVVARIGEMDLAKWWNSNGQLGPLGAATLRRGFPRTHHFAQARSVFAVAAHRCTEVFDSPNSVTLWHLPAGLDDAFDARWEHWLDNGADWRSFFQQLERLAAPDLVAALSELHLTDARALNAFSHLRRTAEGRAVSLPGTFSGTDDDLTLLALGFARGEVGSLAVPFARRDGA